MRVAPRKDRPFVPGREVVLILRPPHLARTGAGGRGDAGTAQKGKLGDGSNRSAQLQGSPATRRIGRHDPPDRDSQRGSGDPDGRVHALRRRGPGLPARVRRRRRAPGPLQLPRRRPATAADRPRRRPGLRPDERPLQRPHLPGHDPDPAGERRRFLPGPAERDVRRRRSVRSATPFHPQAPHRPDAGHPAVPGRRSRRALVRRCLDLRTYRPAPGSRPDRHAAGLIPGERPGPGFRPPDPHAFGRGLAPHRGASEPSSRPSTEPPARPTRNLRP
jgi:hypothetical protein